MAKLSIQSPLPGTFYRKPAPDAPLFITDGAEVMANSIIGLIEVMKSFHEIPAGMAGSNIQFLVEDGDAIMAGQVLAELDTVGGQA